MKPNLASLLPLIILSTLQLSTALQCYLPPKSSLLPRSDDCRQVINAIFYAANRPHGNDPKECGRDVPTGDHFERLPRTFHLRGERNTCAVEVDADPRLPLHDHVRETLTLMDIALAALEIWGKCVRSEKRLGMELVGAARQIVTKIELSDALATVRMAREREETGSVMVPGVGELWWSSRSVNSSFDDAR